MRKLFPFLYAIYKASNEFYMSMSVLEQILVHSYKTGKHCFSSTCRHWGKINSLYSYSVERTGEQRHIPIKTTVQKPQIRIWTKSKLEFHSARRTKGHLFSTYFRHLVWTKIESIAIAQNLPYILSMSVYKRWITSYVRKPEKRKTKEKTPYLLLMTDQW